MSDLTPRCTYRIQLSKAFPFDAAASTVEYMSQLGVSHVYCSPILQAGPGSTHGYDVVDPGRISDELGGEAGFRRWTAVLVKHELKLLLDVVPNHMSAAGRGNPWWWDILRNGKSSPYAGYFDIDWDPVMSSLKGKVLLGVLGDRYGRELEAGRLTLHRLGDEVVVRYHELEFPISRESLDGLEVESIAEDRDALDALLQKQHYRLAYWRTAQEELNYRRFFTIDTLVGLHVELEQVLYDSHRIVLQLLADRSVAGLRFDHIDGLRDPDAYLRSMRAAFPDGYMVVEKVLGYGEHLPSTFPVEGTTGYDFITHVDGLFVDSQNEDAMTALYVEFTGEPQPFSEVARSSKQEMMAVDLAPDLERLTTLLVEICDDYRLQRDRTRRELQDAIRDIATALTVYRTYVRLGSIAEDDRRTVSLAIEEAARRNPEIEPDLLAFVGELLLMEHEGTAEREFAGRFQQFTPAVMAKGVEDTAFYRYHRLVSLNEVGGDPGQFGRPVEAFHSYCARIASQWPATMLTLSTHDTKRSADVRSRLDLLSEIPAEWGDAVRGWVKHNEQHRSNGGPDRNIEYLMYQTLVGAWPVDVQRLTQFLLKAARESKVHTSWIDPVAAYEDALMQFAAAVMDDAEFQGDLRTFIERSHLVALGRTASLVQTTLLLTCPGVPDLYQGSEVWELSLVDPDNRRPVDFAYRQRLLGEVRDAAPAAVLARMDDGAPKIWLIARLLEQRRRRPELFDSSGYVPLSAVGSKARHVVSFVRDDLLVVVPRLLMGLGADWGDTTIDLPAGSWIDVLTGAEQSGGPAVALGQILRAFPVAVLARERI